MERVGKRFAGEARSAFTLLELLVVVVIMTALMTMIYRLTGISGGTSAIASTVSKMQRLENALSGYMAAFGSYPPVKIHGYQDMYRQVTEGGEYYSEPEKMYNRNWKLGNGKDEWHQMILQVRAACESQPVGMDFPYEPDQGALVMETSADIINKINKGVYDADFEVQKEQLGGLFEMYLESAKSGFDIGSPFSRFTRTVTQPDGGSMRLCDMTDWNDIKLFRFGLLSFLLPRYLIMMGCAVGQDDNPTGFAQWTANNALPARYWLDGTPYPSWDEFLKDLGGSEPGQVDKKNQWRIEMIPSQSVCQRWIQNLAGDMVSGRQRVLFGVEIGNGAYSMTIERWMDVYDTVYSPGENGSGSVHDQYLLDNYTLNDAYNNSFLYYSPPPYMSYRLWSGGPGGTAVEDSMSLGATFPPWMSLDDLQDEDITAEEQRRLVSAWMSDDIVHLSH